MSKLDIDYLKDIAHNTSRHHDFSNLLTFNTNDFTQNIYPPIQLDEDWQVGLMNFGVYNNIQNITAKNNVFKYSVDNGATWTTILLAPGSYETDTINSEINRLMTINGDTGITISANTITLGSVVNITPATTKVDFTVANSLASLLGFTSVVLSAGYNVSPNPVNINTINHILVNCDIIGNSYLNGAPFPSIYSFPINVNTGERFTEHPIILYIFQLLNSF